MVKKNEDKDGKMREFVDTLFNLNEDPTRRMLELIMFRNILYTLGEQWIEWIGGQSGSFRKKYRNTQSKPTPVDNIVRDYVRTMRALILNKDFAVTIWPNTEDQDDRDAAKEGERFLKHLDLQDDEAFADEKELATDMMIICGTSFIRVFPDMEHDGWALAPGGDPIPDKGEVGCGCVLPFNVAMDELGGQRLDRKRHVGIKSLKPREWAEDTFKWKVSAGKDDSAAINYEQQLMKMVSDVSPWRGAAVNNQVFDMKDDDVCMFYEVEFKPTKAHPNGRYVVATQENVKVYDKMPIPAEKEAWYYSLTDFHYNRVPGRYFSDGGVSDIISPQNTINSIDQATEMNRKGIGRPMVIIPDDVKLKRLDNTGQDAITILAYDAWLSGGQKPEMLKGIPLPETVLKERDTKRTSIQDMSGDPKNILRGNVPSSGASGVLVDILTTTAEASHSPDIARFYRSLKRVYKKRLVLGKTLFTEDRMIKFSGKGTDIEVRAFKGSNLRDNTDVKLELASGVSTTSYGKQQVLMKLVEGGWFGDLSQDPDMRAELLQTIGLVGFKDKTSIDVERAEWENTVFATAEEDEIEFAESGNEMKAPILPGIHLLAIDQGFEGGQKPEMEEGAEQPQPVPKTISFDPMFAFDNHRVHYDVVRRFILTKEFRVLHPVIQIIAIEHAKSHQALMQQEEKIMQEMEEEAEGQEGGGDKAGAAPAAGAGV